MFRRMLIAAAVTVFAVLGLAGAAGAETLSASTIVARHAGEAQATAAAMDATIAAADVNTTVSIMRTKTAALLANQ
ncbi:MAG: hypothetical protein ACR2J8_04205 [Thermomicrobiales bacterium]